MVQPLTIFPTLLFAKLLTPYTIQQVQRDAWNRGNGNWNLSYIGNHNRMATTKTDPKLNLTASSSKKAKFYEGLTREQLIQAYRLMYMSRRIDDREILLKRQQKIFFQMSGAGHEAIGVAAGLALKPGYDWFYPYYRDRALCLALGVQPYDMFLQAVGAADDPSSGGRQMPSHWSYPSLHIVTQSSPTGSQILQAVGCAEGGRYLAHHPKAAEIPTSGPPDYRRFKTVTFQKDEVTYVSLGDGTSSEGEFWEALNAAALDKLPVIFCVEDNGYAISVPVEVQTAGGNISRLVSGFPNFHFEEVDGTDPVASYGAFQRATRYCREGLGPALCTLTSSVPTRTRSPMTSVFTAPTQNASAMHGEIRSRARRCSFFAKASSTTGESISSKKTWRRNCKPLWIARSKRCLRLRNR